jgi:hypothetical protein
MTRVMNTSFSAAAQGMDPDECAAAALLAPDPEPQDPEVDALSVSIFDLFYRHRFIVDIVI